MLLDGELIAWMGWSQVKNAVYAFKHKRWYDAYIDDIGLLFGFPTVDALIVDATSSGKYKRYDWYKWAFTSSPLTLNWVHWWTVDGFPAGGLWNGTAYTAKQHSDADTGAINHGGNVSTDTKHLVSGTLRGGSNVVTDYAMFCLYDMVISYDQCTLSNSATPFTNTLTAQRYVGSGLPGLQIMGGINTTTTGTTGFGAFTYTAANGTTGVGVPGIAANFIIPIDTAPSAGLPGATCFQYASGRGVLTLPLRVGDSGVNKLESVTFNATTTDQINFILSFPIAYFVRTAGTEWTYMHDFVKQTMLPRIYDGACLTFASMLLGGTSFFHGDLNFVWGT